jgi:beta-lysine 5,6-aminomutase beta subunit
VRSKKGYFGNVSRRPDQGRGAEGIVEHEPGYVLPFAELMQEAFDGEAVDLSAGRPYGDHINDGLVQVSFTLPVPCGSSARQAALELARMMRLSDPEVVHCQRLCDGYTHFVVFGRCQHAIDVAGLREGAVDTRVPDRTGDRPVHRRAHRPPGRRGRRQHRDRTHSVGIDAMLNLKGLDGQHGLEAYHGFEVHNLDSQVPNARLAERTIVVNADAILVSQTVTQQNLHLDNLTELVEIAEAEGIRQRVLLICGGPRCANLGPRSSSSMGRSTGGPRRRRWSRTWSRSPPAPRCTPSAQRWWRRPLPRSRFSACHARLSRRSTPPREP